MLPIGITGAHEAEARRWCVGLARGRQVQRILRDDGRPYLDRYFVAGWNPVTKGPGPSVYLHHFRASDASDQVHSHPWDWSASLILVGGYREQRCGPDGALEERDFLPGAVNVLAKDDKHRVDLIGTECWTLFLAGQWAQAWGFSPRC